jgi:hypothetical protein
MDKDHDKHHWSEGPSHGGQLTPPRWMRVAAGPNRASVVNRLGFGLRQWLSGLASGRDANHRLLVCVGPLLLRVWW